MSRYQKGKTNLDFTEARVSEWQWHQLGHMQVCTSLQTTTPTPHHSVFYRPDALPAANQQRQSTEGTIVQSSTDFVKFVRNCAQAMLFTNVQKKTMNDSTNDITASSTSQHLLCQNVKKIKNHTSNNLLLITNQLC